MSTDYTIEIMVVGEWRANCYILTSGEETLVLDPGAEAVRLLEVLQPLNIKALVATHGHSDHIGAMNELRAELDVPIWIHADDVEMAATPAYSGFADEGSDYSVQSFERILADGDVITWGEAQLRVIHTPGHTPGSICLLDEHGRRLFSGDTLFPSGVGRTDFALGNQEMMRLSCQLLGTLDPDLTVFPGHGIHTNLGTEFARNPLLGRMKITSSPRPRDK